MGLRSGPPIWIKNATFRKHFLEVTKGAWIVLGRHAFESCEDEEVFPKSNLLVLSNHMQMPDLAEEHRPAKIVRSMIEVNKFALTNDKPVFVCGGGQTIAMAMPWMLWMDVGRLTTSKEAPTGTTAVRLPSLGVFSMDENSIKAQDETMKVYRYFRMRNP